MAASRHLWVGGLPEGMTEEEIKDRFSKFGKVEGVKLLPQRHPNIGLAAFVDFEDAKSAQSAQSATIKIKGHEIRTNFKSKGGDSRKDQRSRHYYASPERSSRKPKSTSSSDSSSSSSSSESDGSSDSSDSGSSHSASDDHSKKKAEKDPTILKVVNLASRPELALHDAVYYEFSNYTSHPEVRMYTDRDRVYSMVRFRTAWECKSALRGAQGMLIYGMKIKLTAVNRSDFPSGGRRHPPPPPLPGHMMRGGPPGHGPMGGGPPGMGPARSFPPPKDLDPSATRSLFIGNIPKNLSIYELRDTFQRFGPILDVEIKKMSGSATYGFILFFDLMHAMEAKRCMDGERLGGNKIRVGYGKGTPTKTLWVDGIDPAHSDSQVEKHFSKYGKVVRLGVDRQTHTAMIQYDTLDMAKEAIESIRGTYIGASDTKLLADFANRDAKAAFFSRMEAPGTGGPKPYMPSTGVGAMFMEPVGMSPPWMMHGPRPMPMMAMGMGPPHGPPMDYYYGDPYAEADYYGVPPFPPPTHLRRGYPPGIHPFEAGPGGYGNDYEDELRRFYRRREWDKRQEGRDHRHRRRRASTSSSDDDSSERSSDGRTKRKSSSRSTRPRGSTSSKSADEDDAKRRPSRGEKGEDERRGKQDSKESRSAQPKKRESETASESDSDERDKERAKARLKSTRRSKESREKRQKSKMKESKNTISSDKESEAKKLDKDPVVGTATSGAKETSAKTTEAGATSVAKTATSVTKATASVARATEKDKRAGPKKQAGVTGSSKTESKAKKQKDGDERETGKAAAEKKEDSRRKATMAKVHPPSPIQKAKPCKEPSQSAKLASDAVTATTPSERAEASPDLQASARISGTASSSVTEDRPKISFELRSRDHPAKQDMMMMVAVLESDFSSGDEFRLDDDDEDEQNLLASLEPPSEEKKAAPSVPRTHDVPDAPERAPKETHTLTSSRGHTDPPRLPKPGTKTTRERFPSFSDSSSDSSISDYRPRRRRSEEVIDEHHLRETAEGWRERRPRPRRESHDSSRDSYHARQPSYRLSRSPSPPLHEWQARRRPRSPGSQETHHRRRPRSPAHRRPSSPRRRSPPSRRSYSPLRPDPPPARPRTPIQRPKQVRRRGNESPPLEPSQRGRYARRPPSPPSPPPRSRSPIHRHHLRNHSPSPRPRDVRNQCDSPPSSHSRQSAKRPMSPPRPRGDSSSPLAPLSSSHVRQVAKRPSSPPARRRQDGGGGGVHDNLPESKRRKAADEWQGGSGRAKDWHQERREQPPKPRTPSGSPPLPKSEGKPGKRSLEAESVAVKPSRSSNVQPPLPKAVPTSHPPKPPLPKSEYPSPPSQPSQGLPLPDSQQSQDDLLGLLRRYPVMWQGHLILKSDFAAVQLHFLSGNASLARLSLPGPTEASPPSLRIAQRMRLEPAQLDGVEKRIQLNNEHCLLLALPCGRDPEDVQAQTHSLKTSLIAYLLQKQAAGIINMPSQQQAQTTMHVLHIFPPCPFSQRHLQRVAPDLLSSASEDCHLMIIVATA